MLDLDHAATDRGVWTFTSAFYTDHLVVQARLSSPERRLSDHLNGSRSTVELRPLSVWQRATGRTTEPAPSHGQLTKSRILFVVPLAEPDRPSGRRHAAWRATSQYHGWASVGPYSLHGTIHTDAGRDPQLALRLLDQPFLPVTGVTITFPDGQTHAVPTVIVNRHHLDLLALEGL